MRRSQVAGRSAGRYLTGSWAKMTTEPNKQTNKQTNKISEAKNTERWSAWGESFVFGALASGFSHLPTVLSQMSQEELGEREQRIFWRESLLRRPPIQVHIHTLRHLKTRTRESPEHILEINQPFFPDAQYPENTS